MNGKRVGGIACLLTAAGLTLSAVKTVTETVNVSDPSGLGVSRAIGTFFPAVLMFILGTWLLTKKDQD